MKILIFSNSTWNIHNFRLDLIKGLIESGHDLEILCPDQNYISNLEKLNVKLHFLRLKRTGINPFAELVFFLRYLFIIRRTRPDFIFSFTIKPNIYSCFASLFCNSKVIPNISGLGSTFLANNFLSKIIRLLYKFSLFRASFVFFQNKDDLNLFIEQKIVKRRKALILPGSGINLEKFKFIERKKLNKHIKICLIARLIKDKGIYEYIDCIKKINQTKLKDKFTFSLIGDFDENPTSIQKKEVEDWESISNFSYLGFSKDIVNIIKDHDCVVLPSYREGTPRVLLEASAVGRMMIATDVPGCREVIDHGINGLICKSKNSESLYEQVKKLGSFSNYDFDSYGIAARKMVEKKYSHEIITEKYIQVLKK